MSIVILLLGLVSSLQAMLGVRASYLHSDLHNVLSNGQSGISIGFVIKNGPVSMELNYCQKNAKIYNAFVDYGNFVYKYTFDIKTGYFEIPLFVHFYEENIRNSKISIYSGMAINLCISDLTSLRDENVVASTNKGDLVYNYNFDKGGNLYKLGNSTIGFRFGTEFFKDFYVIGVRYSREFLGGLSLVNYVTMKNERFHSFEIYFKVLLTGGEY